MRLLFCYNTLRGSCCFMPDVVRYLIGKGREAVIVFRYDLGDGRMLSILPSNVRRFSVECYKTGHH